MKTYLADLAWATADGDPEPSLVRDPRIRVDPDGIVRSIVSSNRDSIHESDEIRHDLGRALILPGLVNAHSHAFQRGLRGATHFGRGGDDESFWSWRDAMYTLANALDPDALYQQTRACYAEMLASGITCVGEFHYVHHQPGGTPYDDPNELGHAVVAAAADVGIRLVLLDVFYARSAGVGASSPGDVAPRPEQRRFCDPNVDAYLRRVESLLAHRDASDGARLDVGLAPHSVRAVARPALEEIAAFGDRHELPIHVHVSEQPRENDECAAEHGKTPTEVLAEAGCLARPGTFTAVHAIHVSPRDRQLLANQHVCACPSTEADLGDGIVPASEFLAAGTTLALGSDSNALIDLVREAGALELNERLRTGRRVCLGRPADDGVRVEVAPTLVEAMTRGGASSVGRPDLGRLCVGGPFDAAVFDLDHPSLVDVAPEHALAALLLTGSSTACRETWVAGERFERGGGGRR